MGSQPLNETLLVFDWGVPHSGRKPALLQKATLDLLTFDFPSLATIFSQGCPSISRSGGI